MSDDGVDFEVRAAGDDPVGDDPAADRRGRPDLIDAGRPPSQRLSSVRNTIARIPTRVQVVLVVVAVVAAAVGVVSWQQSQRAPGPAIAGPTKTAAPVAANPQTLAFNRLAVLAESPGPLEAALGPGETTPSCLTIPVGQSLLKTVQDALSGPLPGFTMVDASNTMTNDAVLCGLDVRLRDPLGAVVIVSIAAPPQGSAPDLTAERSNDRTTILDVAVVSYDWRIEVGWVGQTGAQPVFANLLKAAHNLGVFW